MMRSHDEPPRDGGPSDLDAELLPLADALRRMPAVHPGAIARVTAAARGEAMPLRAPRRRWSVGLASAAAALVVLASGIGLASRHEPGAAATAGRELAAGTLVAPALVVHAPDTEITTAVLTTASLDESGALDDAPVPVPFVLRLPDAGRVALVGDFNGWSPRATPLARSANGVWTVTVSLTPGRHAYGFVVDDSLWVRDPRADIERDTDYGRDHSVIVVGRP